MYQIPFVLQMLLPLQIVTYFDRWKIFHLAKNIFNEKIKENLQQVHHIFAKKRTSIFQILPQITIVESGTNFCQILFFNVESSTKIQ